MAQDKQIFKPKMQEFVEFDSMSIFISSLKKHKRAGDRYNHQ